MNCPHCNQPVFKSSNGGTKLKARTSILVLHKAGEVEINCGICGQGILVPLELKKGAIELKKAEGPRFVIPKA